MTKAIGGGAGAAVVAPANAAGAAAAAADGGPVRPAGAEEELKLAQALYTGDKQAYRPYPDKILLPFEFSPDVTKAVNNGSKYEYIHQLNLADGRINDARTALANIKQSDIPGTVAEIKQPEYEQLRDTMRGAHFALSNSVEGRAHFHPDGTMWEQDAQNPKIIKDQSAQDFLATVVFRLKGSDTGDADIASIDTALMKVETAGDALDYGKTASGKPELDTTRKLLDEAHDLIQHGLNNAGTNSADASKWAQAMNHLQQLTKGQSRAVLIGTVVGAALIGTTVGVLVAKN